MSDMQDFVVRLNISRFKQQLSREVDIKARSLLEHLLAAEEKKLHELMAPCGARRKDDHDGSGPDP